MVVLEPFKGISTHYPQNPSLHVSFRSSIQDVKTGSSLANAWLIFYGRDGKAGTEMAEAFLQYSRTGSVGSSVCKIPCATEEACIPTTTAGLGLN